MGGRVSRGRVPGKSGWISRCVFIAGATLMIRTPPVRAQGAVSTTLGTSGATAQIAGLQTNPAWAMLTITNAAAEDLQGQVRATLSRSGGDILVAHLGPAALPFGSIPGSPDGPVTTVITAPRMAPWSQFVYTGEAGQQIHDTGRLPDGDWTLCVTLTGLTGVTTGRPQPDATACSTFIIRYPEAPRLLLPVDRTSVNQPHPVFQWTPVTGVAGAVYRFRLVEMMKGQSPRDAVEGDRPVLETFLGTQTTLLYPPAAYPLQAGACYAWQVQSVKYAGSDLQPALEPVGTNQGRSQIHTFCYRPPHVAVLPDTLPADTTPGAGVALGPGGWGARAPPGASAFGSAAYGARGGYGAGADQQASSAGPVTATGSITAYGELYDMSGTGGQAARPDQTGRIEVATTLSAANGLVKIPLQALISSDQVSFRQEIDQVGVSPTWRDYTLHAGYFSPRFGELTLSDARLLGGGLEGRPGHFHFQGGYGRTRRAILPEPGQLVTPEFTRWMGVGQAGWEASSGLLAEVSLLTARDDAGSLGLFGDSTGVVAPQENFVLGVHGRIPMAARRLSLEVVGTHSSYRADRRAATDAVGDVAGSVALSWRVPTWSLGAKVTYVGPAYRTLGNSQLQADQVRYGLTGELHRGTLDLTAEGGIQQNNLDHTLQSTTKMRGVYNFTMNWQASQLFGLSGNASNVLTDIQSSDPTLALRNLVQSYTLSPTLTWQTGSAQNILSATGTWQKSGNSSLGMIDLKDQRTSVGVLTYTLAFTSGVALTTTGTLTQTKVDSVATDLATLYPALSFPLAQGRLNTMIGFQWSASGVSGQDKDHEFYPQLNASFAVTQRQQAILKVSRRHYAYGEAMPGSTFNETQASLTWKYTF